jgi:hypothetical protein
MRRLTVTGAAEKSGDVIDAAAFLGQHPVGAQYIERVESFALAVFDQADREGFAFGDDPHRHRVIGGDVLLLEQQVERGLATLARADTVFALLAACPFHFVNDVFAAALSRGCWQQATGYPTAVQCGR